jgi:hypothetical protein
MVVAGNDAAGQYIVEHTRNLVVERRFPAMTLTPVSFRYHFRGLLPPSAPEQPAARKVDFTLSLYDAGGDDYNARRYGSSSAQLDAHLAAARRLVVLFDRESSREQTAYLVPHLERLTRDARSSRQLVGGRLPHHVAMCVSKFDRPDLLREARIGGWVNQNAEGDPCVLPGDAEPFASWLAERSPGLARMKSLVETHFLPERVSWSVLSAIGFHRRRDGALDLDDCCNESRDDTGLPILRSHARPMNVLEPLVRLGLVPSED